MSIFQPYRFSVLLNQYITINCQLCQSKLLFTEHIICQNCHNSIVWLPKPNIILLENGQSLTIQATTHYQHPVNSIIKRFKLGHDMSVLPVLVYLLKQLPIPTSDVHNTVIIPMPTTRSRLIERGFDPVLILATFLSSQWNVPLWQDIVMHERKNRQKSLNRSQRVLNMKNAFLLTSTLSVKNVILVDDVSTTGATFKSLAETILEQTDMSLNVYAFCLAH